VITDPDPRVKPSRTNSGKLRGDSAYGLEGQEHQRAIAVSPSMMFISWKIADVPL